MPIYAYRCSNCGHAQDVLQKLSDPVLTVCPACGESTYVKQVTAAGFQLKGSGWYVTDFRGDKKSGKAEGEGGDKAGAAAEKSVDKPAEAKGGESAATGEAKGGDGDKKADGAAAAAPAPAAASPAAPAPAAAPSSGKTSG